jgi:cold shock CspA family protein
METNMKGTVLEYDQRRGFGYVLAENGRRYFAHIRNWESTKPPKANDEVVFDVGPGWNGKPSQCVNIRLSSEVSTLVAKAGAECLI